MEISDEAVRHVHLAVRALVGIVVIEKAINVVMERNARPGQPYYQIDPLGHVPYLVDDAGLGIEDQLICAYLDRPRWSAGVHGPRMNLVARSSWRAACATQGGLGIVAPKRIARERAFAHRTGPWWTRPAHGGCLRVMWPTPLMQRNEAPQLERLPDR